MPYKLNPFTGSMDFYQTGTGGATWFFGEGVPSDAIGDDGDFYINTLNFDLYEKSGGTWL